MKNKRISINNIKKLAKKYKVQGKKIVFTNGCFDLIHEGHIRYLDKAKKLGDILIVGINSDKSVRKIKGGGRPILNEKERVIILSSLEMIDYIIVFNEDDPIELIKKIQPQYHVKGGDYKPKDLKETKTVEKYNGKIVIIPFVKGKSTTNIINKIKNI